VPRTNAWHRVQIESDGATATVAIDGQVGSHTPRSPASRAPPFMPENPSLRFRPVESSGVSPPHRPRESMGSTTLQTLHDPVLLLPWSTENLASRALYWQSVVSLRLTGEMWRQNSVVLRVATKLFSLSLCHTLSLPLSFHSPGGEDRPRWRAAAPRVHLLRLRGPRQALPRAQRIHCGVGRGVCVS
jgi:hypothetical protein